MLQKLPYLIGFLNLIILASSCSSAVLLVAPALYEENNSGKNHFYMPDEPNDARLAKENDANISFSGSRDSGDLPKGLKLGYSPKKHLGILLDHSYYHRPKSISRSSNPGRQWKYRMTQLGVGTYYFHQSKKQIKYTQKTPNKYLGTLFDLYAGYGRGSIKNNFRQGGDSKLTMQKIYLQAGIHIHQEIIGLSFINRFGFVHYPKGVLNGNFESQFGHGFSYIRNNNRIPTIETSVKISIGKEKFQYFSGFTFTRLQDEDAFSFRNTVGYIGFLFHFNFDEKK